MAQQGPSVYRKNVEVSEEDNKYLFFYFLPQTSKFEPEQEIKFKSIDEPKAKQLSLALKATKRKIADISFDELSKGSALALLFAAYKNPNLQSRKLLLGTHVKLTDHFLGETNQLIIDVDELSYEQANELAEIVNKAEIENVEIAIKKIPDGCTMLLLGVIGQNPHIKRINIKIPSYTVDDLQALKDFLAKPLCERERGIDEMAALSSFMQKVNLDLQELGSAAQSSFESVRQRSVTFLNAYVLPTLASLVEEQPAEDAQVQQRVEGGRQSPRPAH